MWERHHGEELREVTYPSEPAGINSDEKRFLLGQGRLRNSSLVCLALEEYGSQCMQQRTQLLQERWKARKESSKGAGLGDGGRGPTRYQRDSRVTVGAFVLPLHVRPQSFFFSSLLLQPLVLPRLRARLMVIYWALETQSQVKGTCYLFRLAPSSINGLVLPHLVQAGPLVSFVRIKGMRGDGSTRGWLL